MHAWKLIMCNGNGHGRRAVKGEQVWFEKGFMPFKSVNRPFELINNFQFHQIENVIK